MSKLDSVLDEGYTIALHIDPQVNDDIKKYLSPHVKLMDENFETSLYVPILTIRDMDRKGIINAVETAVRDLAPIPYLITDYKIKQKLRNPRITYSLEPTDRLVDLMSRLMISPDTDESSLEKWNKILSEHLEDLDLHTSGGIKTSYLDLGALRGMELGYPNSNGIRRAYREFKWNFLSRILYPNTTRMSPKVTFCGKIYRLAVFNPDGSFFGEYDIPRRRWLGSHMAGHPVQWGITRFFAENAENKCRVCAYDQIDST